MLYHLVHRWSEWKSRIATFQRPVTDITFLTLKALNYFCNDHENQRCFFRFETIINVLVCSFPVHLNTYVMGLRPLEMTYCAGIYFRRQSL